MAVSSAFRGYSVFDTVMRKQRTERLSRGISANQTDIQVNTLAEKAPTPSEVASKAFAGPATIAEGFASPFMDTQYVSVDKTGQVRTPQPGDQYKISGPTTYLTAGEAAVSPDLRTGYYGPFDPQSGMGKFAYGLAQAVIPVPFISDLVGGNTTVDPYGKEVAIPMGTLGKLARMNIEKQYEIANKIKKGTPGYHQFYSGGQLLSIVPQKNPLTGNFMGNYTVLGTFSGSPQDVISQFAAMHGYNPPSIDLDKKPGEKGFGEELEAFVPGSGGFTKDKRFVSPTGEVTSVPSDLSAHLGLVNTMYGQEVAMNTLTGLNLSEDTASKLGAAIANNTLRAEAVRYSDGSVAGYNTGSGSIVTTKDGTAVRGGGGAVTTGTGALSADQKDELGYQIGTAQRYDTRPGSQQTRMLAEQDREFYDPQRDYDPGFDEGDTGDSGGQGGYGGRGGAENETGYGTPFAQGGFVERTPMQEGGQAPIVNKPGFIEKEPESLPEGMTVADDVEIDVPEGTFVLSAAAVEFMGSADVKAMILETIAEAERQGIDITQDTSKISREDLVSLVVSRGEVVIPPELAQIIGYDRLTKINNRGKQEVQKRIDENGQAEEQPQKPEAIQQAAYGGRQKMAPGGTADFYDPRIDALAYARGAVEATEGLHDEPVVPTASSGLTLNLGLDLGQHSEFDLKNRYGMSDGFIEAAKPFLAKKQGGKGPLGSSAKQLYKKSSSDFTPYLNEVEETFIPKKFEEFINEYPEFSEAPAKDQGALFSMYYLGGLERYQTLQDVYKQTGDIPYSIHKGLLTLKNKQGRQVFTPDDPEYNRAINLLTFYYTGDDADVLENRDAGQQEAYAKNMLKTQLSDRARTAKLKKTGSFLD